MLAQNACRDYAVKVVINNVVIHLVGFLRSQQDISITRECPHFAATWLFWQPNLLVKLYLGVTPPPNKHPRRSRYITINSLRQFNLQEASGRYWDSKQTKTKTKRAYEQGGLRFFLKKALHPRPWAISSQAGSIEPSLRMEGETVRNVQDEKRGLEQKKKKMGGERAG